jgi:hypothetical protein
MLAVDTEPPESADEDFFALLQGLLDDLKERPDDLGLLGFGEDALGEKFFHDVGLGESHTGVLRGTKLRPSGSCQPMDSEAWLRVD